MDNAACISREDLRYVQDNAARRGIGGGTQRFLGTWCAGAGATGRVRLTTLTREFFMPRFLERDEAEREPPYIGYPWDGVRNVRPFSRFQKAVVEGVY